MTQSRFRWSEKIDGDENISGWDVGKGILIVNQFLRSTLLAWLTEREWVSLGSMQFLPLLTLCIICNKYGEFANKDGKE